MILKELILSMDEDEKICIGAKTGFLYFGTVDHFLDIKDKINKRCKKYLEECLTRYKRELKRNDYSERTKLNLAKMRKEASDFIPIELREVRESYKRMAGDTAILITGFEMGVMLPEEISYE